MNLILFIIIIIISFVVVRLGAIAFELTGLEWTLAKFQALSCFTGTGFTTKEAELVTGNTQRRRIASLLMVLGNAGLVTLIATFANSLRPSELTSQLTPSFLQSIFSSHFPSYLLPWIHLLIIIVSVYTIFKISQTKFARKLTDILKKHIIKKKIIKPVSFEELLVATGGYGISSIEVCKDSSILNKRLVEAELRTHDITLLAIERDEKIIPNPPAATKFLLGDKLICFGKLDIIRKQLCSI